MDHRLRQRDSIVTSLHADHGAIRANSLREQSETALGTTSDLDDVSASRDPDAVKEPIRLVSKLLGLFLKTLLLCVPITKQVLIRFRHVTPATCAQYDGDKGAAQTVALTGPVVADTNAP